jgi:hypothetical protein
VFKRGIDGEGKKEGKSKETRKGRKKHKEKGGI